MTKPLQCSRCSKRLSRKSARLIEGKVLCSACLFPPLKKGIGFLSLTRNPALEPPKRFEPTVKSEGDIVL